MEERRNTHPQGADHSRKRRKVRPGHVAGGVVMTVFTLVLIGVCTTLMLLGIFMKYVNTSLLPTLEVRAEDYTMSQSSVVYYQDKESGQWVEFQKVHGQENRVLIDIDDMSPYLWQAAVSIEDERFFSHHGANGITQRLTTYSSFLVQTILNIFIISVLVNNADKLKFFNNIPIRNSNYR